MAESEVMKRQLAAGMAFFGIVIGLAMCQDASVAAFGITISIVSAMALGAMRRGGAVKSGSGAVM
ncbi:hypothetical protein [Micromonospora coxensis]|uniref:Uncharacterized protein n=1 Tax=Micromonospora coxensis TaxID=356852 RepID=A0A1C5J921_9ACTN|nr:hypothetical protein [Micromonospora coxensis]SCG67114.1 hypothetical protein GA0070614_4194 [Micromonospora coxensis]